MANVLRNGSEDRKCPMSLGMSLNIWDKLEREWCQSKHDVSYCVSWKMGKSPILARGVGVPVAEAE